MIIDKPYIETRNDKVFLISLIKDEITNVNEEIYFSVSKEYSKYFCNEIGDAFVVAMLLPALVSGQDIKVNAPISEMLYYQLENSMIYTLCKVFNKKPITIYPSSTLTIDFHPKAISTGMSGGIDSFTTIFQHMSENCPEEMRLNHLSLFNVGSYGNKESETRMAFEADSIRAKQYSEYVNLPLVLLNSNISVLYNSKELFHFSSRSAICIIAGVLSMQKLYKVYLLASTCTIDQISLNKHDQYYYDFLVASFLSTSNTKIIITNADLNRVEKTKMIVNDKTVQKFLYVCAADILNEKNRTNYLKDTKDNCSECVKCKRTLCTLDVLGCLNKFSDRFDLQKYNKQKKGYIIQILSQYKVDHWSKEIYDLMIEINYRIPKRYRLYALTKRFKVQAARFKIVRLIYHGIKDFGKWLKT